MAIRKYKPTTPGRRGSSVSDFAEITRSTPEKSLLRPLPGADPARFCLHGATRRHARARLEASGEGHRLQQAHARQTLRRIERKTPPVDDVPAADRTDAWWVTPRLVGEVSLAGRTRDQRVRQAAWRGWRRSSCCSPA